VEAQTAALRKLGVQATFKQSGSRASLEAALKSGQAVTIGITSSTSGHWVYVLGTSANGIRVFDPISKEKGESIIPWQRWLPEGLGGSTGWYMTAKARR
jgi:hypothetical protein